MIKNIKKERIIFYENIMYGLENYCSSNDEVNELLNELYKKVFKLKCDTTKFENNCIYELSSDIKNGRSIIREVYIGDLMLNCIFEFLHESATFEVKDEISDLIFKIYSKLDMIVHPYQIDNHSDIDVKNYIELIYEED